MVPYDVAINSAAHYIERAQKLQPNAEPLLAAQAYPLDWQRTADELPIGSSNITPTTLSVTASLGFLSEIEGTAMIYSKRRSSSVRVTPTSKARIGIWPSAMSWLGMIE